MPRLTLRRVPLAACDWQSMDALPDRVIYQTREWLTFVSQTQRAEPVVTQVLNARGRCVGYFTGLVTKKAGVKILGSPFPGWNAGPMGFNLDATVDRRSAVEALLVYAFGPLRCLHLELLDAKISLQDVGGLGFESSLRRTYGIDLQPDEDAIFAAANKACRKAIRKSRKLGVTIEEARGEDFAGEYHAQLVDVFAKQSLTPTVSAERVAAMIRALEPTGRIQLLRARSAEGEPIATAIFLGMNDVAYSWGGASWRSRQDLRPNEALTWHAIQTWKARGVRILDLGGGTEEGFAAYKRKFGPADYVVPYLRKSRFAAVATARTVAEHLARRGLPRLRIPAARSRR
ncbi:hypothetical protein BH20ACT16_BH20ACT16_06820 [soil metagenome]